MRMMRIEATVPDSRGAALKELAEELGLSKSEIIDEALALFIKVVEEARRGRRVVSVGSPGELPCEITTPSLTLLEWMHARQGITLSTAAVEHMADLIASPPAPNAALRAALTEES